MKHRYALTIACIIVLLFLGSCTKKNSQSPEPVVQKTIVDHFGQLQVDGYQIKDKNNMPVALHGMSLFWSQWAPQFYNKDCVQWLRDDWKCTIIRAAMAVDNDGYLTNPAQEMAKIRTVVDACIELGIYVIIDWHSHHGEDQTAQAKAFFKQMAQLYGDHPNVIYEIYNEPLQVSWDQVIKPYAEAVIAEIRSEDPDNLIIVGTPTWSQDVDVVVANPIVDPNVAYVLHFYTGTHRQELRDKANIAVSNNIPLFVSEWGVSEADASGTIDYPETNRWLEYTDAVGLSWCNWSVTDKDETPAILKPGTNANGNWTEDDLTEAGRFVRGLITSRNTTLFEALEE